MDKNKIKKEYNKKIKNLIKLNKHYYDLNKPLLNDSEYDQFKEDILFLEKKYDFLESENSPSKIVGFKPSKTFKKVFHRVPMLSLSNAFDEEDLVNFEKKINNFLDQKSSNEYEYSAEPKIDGISASLLGYNYQSSKWYENSYSLFDKTYKKRKKERFNTYKKKSGGLIKKFKTLLE